jgi:hypothetical protein
VELERVQQELAQSEERAKNHWDQYLRAVAELDNVRKRAQRDIEAANRYGLEKFVLELLPVKDSLELAVGECRARRQRKPRRRPGGHPAAARQGPEGAGREDSWTLWVSPSIPRATRR